jgi:hypothetical protein
MVFNLFVNYIFIVILFLIFFVLHACKIVILGQVTLHVIAIGKTQKNMNACTNVSSVYESSHNI